MARTSCIRHTETPFPGRAPTALALARGKKDLLVLVVIAATVLLSRLPFLTAGYGLINDAWRLAYSAHEIALTHRYAADRFPPHPLQEVVSALFWRGGPLALNGATALLSVLAATYFALTLKRLGSRDYLVGALAFASVPIIYINSTNSMDYVWSLAFLLGSFYSILGAKPLCAGLLLGLSIACRLTTVVLLIPFGLLLVSQSPSPMRLRALVTFSLASCGLGALAYVPALVTYGWTFLGPIFEPHPGQHPAFSTVVQTATIAVWGQIGLFSVIAALLLGMVSLFRADDSRLLSRKSFSYRQVIMVSIVVIYLLLFIHLPDQPGYLVPIVPFTMIVAHEFLSRRLFVTCCFFIILSPFVTLHRSSTSSGSLINDHTARLADMKLVMQMITIGDRLPKRSIVVAGHWLSQIMVYQFGYTREERKYVWLLDGSELQHDKQLGFGLFYCPGQREFTLRTYGVDLVTYGAIPLLKSHPQGTSTADASGGLQSLMKEPGLPSGGDRKLLLFVQTDASVPEHER
jgi:hypothetical protein